MADLQRALEWAKQHPEDERSKKLLSLVGSNQISQDSVNARSIVGEQAAVAEGKDKGFFQTLADKLDKRVENVGAIQGNEDISAGGKALQTFGQGAGVGADILGEGISRVASAVTPDFIEEPIKELATKTVTDLVNTDQFKSAAEAYASLKKAHPELSGDLEAVGNIFNLGASLTGAGAGAKALLKTGEVAAGGVGKAAAATGRGVGTATEFATSQATGMSPSTIRQILETPGAFTKEEIAKVDSMSIANKVKNALDKRSTDLSETGKVYETIRKSGESVNIEPTTIQEVLGKYGVNIGEDGKISLTSESVPLSQGDIASIERFIGQYGKESTLSANAFLNARKALSEMAKYDAAAGKSDFSTKISRDLRAAYDKFGKEQLTGLAETDKKYAPEIKQISQYRKDFLNNDGSLKDNALSKLSNLTGKNKDIVLGRVEKLVPGITKDVNILRAINDIEYAKGQKVGAYLKGGTAGFIVSGGNPIVTVLSAIATSPQAAVPMIRAFAKTRNAISGTVNRVMNKLRTGEKLVGDEIKVFQDAINLASSKIQDRLKNVRPGLNIQDINTMTPEQRSKLPFEDIRSKIEVPTNLSPKYKKLIERINNLGGIKEVEKKVSELWDKKNKYPSYSLKYREINDQLKKLSSDVRGWEDAVMKKLKTTQSSSVISEMKNQAKDRSSKLHEIATKINNPKIFDRATQLISDLEKPTKETLQQAEKLIEEYSAFVKGRKLRLNELKDVAASTTFDKFLDHLRKTDNRYAKSLLRDEERAKDFFITSKRLGKTLNDKVKGEFDKSGVLRKVTYK